MSDRNPYRPSPAMRPVPDKPIRLGGGGSVPDGWHVVYQCPSCGRYFDSPTVCEDGSEAVPRLERIPRVQRHGEPPMGPATKPFCGVADTSDEGNGFREVSRG